MEMIMKAIVLFLGFIASVSLLTSCASKHCNTNGQQYAVEKEQGHTEVTNVERPKEHRHIDYKGESLNK
jgi:ABC-type Fe3+-citrate transport system substrate-binding protein